MENIKRKWLVVVVKNGFQDKFNFPFKPSSEESLSEDIVKLTFNDKIREIDNLISELHGAMIVKRPCKREIILIADESGVLYKE